MLASWRWRTTNGPAIGRLAREVQVLYETGRFTEALERGPQLEHLSSGRLDADTEAIAAIALRHLTAVTASHGPGAEAALALADRLIARFGSSRDPRVRAEVMELRTARAGLLVRCGRGEEGTAELERLLATVKVESGRRRIRAELADALLEAQKYDDACRVSEEILLSEGSRPAETAVALVTRAEALRRSGRQREALAAFEELVARISPDVDRICLNVAAMARRMIGSLHLALDEPDEGVKCLRQLLSDCADQGANAPVKPFGEATLTLARHYASIDDLGQAIETLDLFLTAAEQQSGDRADQATATALLWKAEMLAKVHRVEEARSVVAEIHARFEHDNRTNLLERVRRLESALDSQPA